MNYAIPLNLYVQGNMNNRMCKFLVFLRIEVFNYVEIVYISLSIFYNIAINGYLHNRLNRTW